MRHSSFLTRGVYAVLMHSIILMPNVHAMADKPIIILPYSRKKVMQQDYIRVMAAFMNLAPEAKIVLAHAVHRGKSDVDDPKTIAYLLNYDLVDTKGTIIGIVKTVIAGISKFEKGELIIDEDAVKIKGKPGKLVTPHAYGSLKQGSLKHKEHNKSESKPVIYFSARSFTVHGPSECCTYTSNQPVDHIAKQACTYCNHPAKGCPQKDGDCLYCRPRTQQKMLNIPDNHIVEFRDRRGYPTAWYKISLDIDNKRLIEWGLERLTE